MTDVPQLPSLAQLIVAVKDRNDWPSDTPLIEGAKAAGFKLTKSDVSNYRVNGMKAVKPLKIRGLAAGLRVPERVVATAVLTDMGVDMGAAPSSIEEAVRVEVNISDKARRMILAILTEDRV